MLEAISSLSMGPPIIGLFLSAAIEIYLLHPTDLEWENRTSISSGLSLSSSSKNRI